MTANERVRDILTEVDYLNDDIDEVRSILEYLETELCNEEIDVDDLLKNVKAALEYL